MYNNLYNTPVAVGITTPWFHGCEQNPGMGRACIITADGVLYAAIGMGEDKTRVIKSVDNGYTWTIMHIFQQLQHAVSTSAEALGGVCLYLDYSETDEVLYIIYLDTFVGGEYDGNICPYLYDVTNGVGIGFIAEGWIDCRDSRFAAGGHIDRKILIAWSNVDDADELWAILVDKDHYNSTDARAMTLDPLDGTIDTGSAVDSLTPAGARVGLFDVSEVDNGWWLWWVAAVNGRLYRKKVNVSDTVEDITADANVETYNPGEDVITELFGCENCVLFSRLNVGTPANSRLLFYSVSGGGYGMIAHKAGNGYFSEDCGGTYGQYAWPQMLFVKDGAVDKMQAFFMGRDSGDTFNRLETCDIIISTQVESARKVVTGSLQTPWSLRNKCFCIFEAPNRTQGDINGRGSILVAVGNGTPEGFGHRSGDCTIYTEWLANNAYPLSITSTYISAAPADYHTAGNLSQHEKQAEMAFEKRGIPLLVLKYELSADPQVRTGQGYIAPVEIEIKGFINELSLKNPTNITLEATEEFKSVMEKDIRQLYFPASTYLGRTYKRARRGFVMRTIYLLKFYGRFYEITQIVPVFGKNGIICNKANLYVCGASYDPFTRKVLPNET